MRSALLLLPLASWLIGCASPPVVIDVREKLLESARAQYPEFPPNRDVKLTRFAYLGHAEGPDGPIYVASVRAVCTGMFAPRGLGYTMFFDRNFKFLGTIEREDIEEDNTGWCEGSRVYLRGRTWALPTRSGGSLNNGNAVDLSRGWDHWDLIDVYEYGSSGGIPASIPTEADRRSEREHWDDK